MIYTPMTNKAIKLMFEAHKNQVDKSGLPYVFHPWHVAESMIDEKRCTVALLHDVVEDTSVTLEDLKNEGFPEDVLEAINILTHKEGVDYAEYIRGIAGNEIATDVKISDLHHNIDESRLIGTNISNIKKELYRSSLEYLLRVKQENIKSKLIR